MARIESRNGRYRARVWAPDGRERSKTFDRRSDAERWAVTQEADKHRGSWIDPTLGRETFAAWAATWKATLHGLKPSTLDLNLRTLRVHLLPRFGPMPLSRITHADVQRMVAEDISAGYSGSATRRHVIVLRQVLKSAVQSGRLGRNVAEGVQLPPEGAREMRFLSADQLAGLAAVVKPQHYRPLILTAGWVGLRWGELAGLRLRKVDLLRRKIRIDEQLVEIGGDLSFGTPKTRAGVRTVTIPGGLVEVLAEHFATEPVQSSGMAFPTVTGKLMRRRGFYTPWRRAVDGDAKRGTVGVFTGSPLERLVVHELRHTAAALAIAAGAHPMVVKTRLGHASITTTMDRYGHLFPDADEALADALDATFRQAHPASTRPETPDVAHIRRSQA